MLFAGDRRMEAETYLSSGFALRQAIETKRSGWSTLGSVARIWMPGRLKGIQVQPHFGTPFLAATQVFDARPIPRKWLALARTADSANRFVRSGQILVTCSGAVGRPTVATEAHAGTLISHDLLRVDAIRSESAGWLYAYLQSSQVRQMAAAAQYGHIIKHLEPEHLAALPIPQVDPIDSDRFGQNFSRILELRNQAHALSLKAESAFEAALGPALTIANWGEVGFSTTAASTFATGRRRLEASVHNPGVVAIRRHLEMHGRGTTTLADEGYEVWLPNRFKRIPADDGVLMLQSADLSEVNPVLSKRIADTDFGDPFRGRVESGWVLMARSGQSYGIIGTAVLAGKALEGLIVSDDVMRIRPAKDDGIQAGYVVTAMSHPLLGRPLVKSLTYGSSIPHIDVSDIVDFPIVRLAPEREAAICELAVKAANARSEADVLERAMAQEADEIIASFIAAR